MLIVQRPPQSLIRKLAQAKTHRHQISNLQRFILRAHGFVQGPNGVMMKPIRFEFEEDLPHPQRLREGHPVH